MKVPNLVLAFFIVCMFAFAVYHETPEHRFELGRLAFNLVLAIACGFIFKFIFQWFSRKKDSSKN